MNDTEQQLADALAAANPATVRHAAAGAAAARTALGLALELGRLHEAGQARGWLCTHLFRQGLFDEQCQEADAALPAQATPELAAERFETLRLLAQALCEQGRFGPAFEAARRLVQEGEDSGDPGRALLAAHATGACFDRIGDPWQGSRVLQEALLRHERAVPERALFIASLGLCAFLGDGFYRERDVAPSEDLAARLAQARVWAEKAQALLGPQLDPLFAVTAGGNLGEVLLHQGELERAGRLIGEAVRRAREAGLRAHGWRAQAAWCEWLVATGRGADARSAAEALLAEMGPAAPLHTEIRARDAAHRACLLERDFEAALLHFKAFERLERRRTLAEMKAQGELFVTRLEADQTLADARRAHAEAAHQRRRASEFERRAEHDPLTGLGNRSQLRRRAADWHRRAPRSAPWR